MDPISEKSGRKRKRKEPTEELPRLYLRFKGKKPEEVDIRALHPLIQNVMQPRQKSSRFCFLECANKEDALVVMAALKEKNMFVSLKEENSKQKSEDKPVKFKIQRTGRKNVDI